MKHLKQVIEEGNLDDAIRLYLKCNQKIKCIHDHEVVELSDNELKDYEVEEVCTIELDEDSGFELAIVWTHTALLRLMYYPEYEVITDIVDETDICE